MFRSILSFKFEFIGEFEFIFKTNFRHESRDQMGTVLLMKKTRGKNFFQVCLKMKEIS
jgi:hypothetical protein